MSDVMDSDFEDDEFSAAAEQVQRSHRRYMPEDLLELYGLYKQATVGNCNVEKPGIFSMQGRAKWCAWNERKNMTTEEAKKLYVKKVKEIDSQYLHGGQSKERKSVSSWAVLSIEAPPEDFEKPESEKNIYDFVKDGNFERVQYALKFGNINQLDENGIGLLHWAADRNHPNIVKLLLENGADVNIQDADQQTALHYACSVGNVDCIRILLDFNADRSIKDYEGHTCLDVAENEAVLSLVK